LGKIQIEINEILGCLVEHSDVNVDVLDPSPQFPFLIIALKEECFLINQQKDG
jgi:hypothetical protein